jgi:TPR repeat protein
VGSSTDYADSLHWYRKEIKWKMGLGDWLYKTADEGDMLEKAWFGTMFALNESAREVTEWLQRAVDEKDDPAARLLLAADYDDSLYFWSREKDIEAAGLWLQQAADTGSSLACFGLGALYYNGRGVKRDRAKAQAWFAQAAERDSRYAYVREAVQSEQAKKKRRLYRDWFGDSPILQYMEYLV